MARRLYRLVSTVSLPFGHSHTLALKSDGTVVAWGSNNFGQSTVPAGLSGVVAIAAGDGGSIALKNDGTVVVWGAVNKPPDAFSEGKAIAAAGFNTVGILKKDGTVVVWGHNEYGQANVPAGLSGVTAIAGGPYQFCAVKDDGTVAVWGDYVDGSGWQQSFGPARSPNGLSGVISIAAGQVHTVAVMYDGTMVAWGTDSTSVPQSVSEKITKIAAGHTHIVALKDDGTVAVWGDNSHGQTSVPSGLTGVTAIAAGGSHTLALKNDGTVVAWGGQTTVPSGLVSRRDAVGAVNYDPASLSATFTPTTPLLDGVTYYATVAGVKSQNGTPLAAPVRWSFRTYDALNITTAAFPEGITGIEFSQSLIVTGGLAPYSWSITSGNLPPGLSLDGVTGLISGTATATGAYTFTVQAVDANTTTTSKPLTINIVPLAITTATVPSAVTGALYNQTLAVTSGRAPYSWSISSGTLPPACP